MPDRSEHGRGEDAGAVVSHQQMNPVTFRYPVDRYLVQSNNQNELVNIISDDIWNSEPALRPEDEIMLRKLHEMLQSTADDLKVLSHDITKHHEQGLQVKSTPTPLDEEFNEKVHIEEIVNAKFHGHKIIEKSTVNNNFKTNIIKGLMEKMATKQKSKDVISTGIQVNRDVPKSRPLHSKIRNLTASSVKTIDINTEKDYIKDKKSLPDSKKKNPPVSYNEFSYKYVEPKIKPQINKCLHLQDMPSINIRSELKTQKVLELDIIPQMAMNVQNLSNKNNVAVISVHHDSNEHTMKSHIDRQIVKNTTPSQSRPSTRKTLKMSAGETSESTSQDIAYSYFKTGSLRRRKKIYDTPSMSNQIQKNKTNIKTTREIKRSQKHLEEWQRRLNSVYRPLISQKPKTEKSKSVNRKKDNLNTRHSEQNQNIGLNNAEYIPYSKLTLGGVRVSDIEDEISNISNKNNLVLSPILDKILSSRENSFHSNSPRKNNNHKPKILTTSDENLLQEVLDVQNNITDIIPEGCKTKLVTSEVLSGGNDSYADDFDDEKTDTSENSDEKSNHPLLQNDVSENETNHKSQIVVTDRHNNRTYTKLSNLSFKRSVDIFEFVHSVDTQDNSTQSNHTSKISLKETQTSPRNDKTTIQPIHNDLWPSIDPSGDVEKMFKLEKDFIKKLIIDEYSDVIEKTLNKPSTSNSCVKENTEKNIISSQKNTQTSPAHVKTVMTSPTRTKTRTTSPFVSSVVSQQLSPIIVTTKENVRNIEEDDNELAISINLSSPRFNLRLPQSSREVLSNVHAHAYNDKEHSPIKEQKNENISRSKRIIPIVSSSSSVEADYSSDISSIGEIHRELKKHQRKSKMPLHSDLSSSSSISKSSFEMSTRRNNLRSEGEISLGQINNKKSRNNKGIRKSDGELSLGQLL